MANALSFYPAHSALLGMDCQTCVVSIYAKPPEPFLERCSSVLRAARKVGMSVIHVKVGFRPGLPEVTMRNRLFASIKSSPQHHKLFEGTAGAIHPKLGPEPDDIVVTKHRISAFPASDLQMILRAKGVDTLVRAATIFKSQGSTALRGAAFQAAMPPFMGAFLPSLHGLGQAAMPGPTVN